MNMVALTTLLAYLENPVHTSAHIDSIPAVSSPPPTAVPEPLPALIAVQEMETETRALVQALNSLGPQGEARTMASMYRQLAHWPGYLALALALIHPLHANGQLQSCVECAQTQARALAQELLTQLAPGATSPPEGESRAALQTALSAFTSNLIVEMLPVAKILRAAQP